MCLGIVCDVTDFCVRATLGLMGSRLSMIDNVTHFYVWQDLFLRRVKWGGPICDVPRYCVWRDSLLRVTWLISMCDITYFEVWHVHVSSEAFFCVMCHGIVCDVTHSCACATMGLMGSCFLMIGNVTHFYAWYDSLLWVTWLILVCDVIRHYVWLTHFCVCDCVRDSVSDTQLLVDDSEIDLFWPESFLCVIWLVVICHVTHSRVWHDSVWCGPWLIPAFVQLWGLTGRELFLCLMCLGIVCDVTDFCVRATLGLMGSRLSTIGKVTHSFVTHSYVTHSYVTHSFLWHDSFLCVAVLIPVCDMTRYHV